MFSELSNDIAEIDLQHLRFQPREHPLPAPHPFAGNHPDHRHERYEALDVLQTYQNLSFFPGEQWASAKGLWVRKQEDNSPARPHKHLEYFWSLCPMLKPPLSITKTGRWPLELHSKLEGLQPLKCPIIRPCKWNWMQSCSNLNMRDTNPFQKYQTN